MSKVQTFYSKTPSLTLKQMENRLNNDEAMWLALTLVGHTDSETLFTFTRAGSAPATKVDLVLASPARTDPSICKGKIWVNGVLAEVAAYRRKP